MQLIGVQPKLNEIIPMLFGMNERKSVCVERLEIARNESLIMFEVVQINVCFCLNECKWKFDHV